MATHFKTYLNFENESDIKRFSLNEDVVKCFDFLENTIYNLYPDFTITSIKYKDSDGDYITIASDSDLIEALGLMPHDTIKLYLTGKMSNRLFNEPQVNKSDVKDIREEGIKEKDQSYYHPNIICDGCDGSIYGTRYKCSVCFDYDLCASCEGQKLHSEHPLLKINKPIKKFYSNLKFAGYQNEFNSSFKGPKSDDYDGPFYFNNSCNLNKGKHRENVFSQNYANKNGANVFPPNIFPFASNYWTSFLKNLGQGLNTLFDPLGIDVNVDINGYDSGTSTPQSQKYNTKGKQPHNTAKDNSFPKGSNFSQSSHQDSYDETSNAETFAGQGSTPENLRNFLKNTSTLFTPNIKININGTDVLSTSFSQYTATSNENTDANAPEKGEEVFDTASSSENNTPTEKVTEIPILRTDIDEIPTQNEELDKDNMDYINNTCKDTLVSDTEMSENILSKDIHIEETPSTESWDLLDHEEMDDDNLSNERNGPFEKIENPINDALKKLEAMGYVNEGGWLTYLLNMKDGDITKVLDIIHPN